MAKTRVSNWAQLLRARVEAAGDGAVLIGRGCGPVGLTGHDLGAQGRIGGEHAMEAKEMESGTRDECGQALEEFQRAHDEMGGAIAILLLCFSE